MLTLLGIVGGGTAALPLLFALAPGLLPSVLARLTGSAIGRKVAIALLIAIGVLLAVWRIHAAGRSAERARQAAASLRNLRTRMKVDDEISQLTVDERRRRLAQWVRD